jgi:hypothetical protein
VGPQDDPVVPPNGDPSSATGPGAQPPPVPNIQEATGPGVDVPPTQAYEVPGAAASDTPTPPSGLPPTVAQPPTGGQPQYGQQPPTGGQPQYSQQPPPGGQPQYGQQPQYGGPAPFDTAATTANPQFGTPPPAGGQPKAPFVDYESDGEERNKVLLMVAVGILALVLIGGLLFLFVLRDDNNVATTDSTTTSLDAVTTVLAVAPVSTEVGGTPVSTELGRPSTSDVANLVTTIAPETTAVPATTVPATTLAPSTTVNPCASTSGTVVTGVVAGAAPVVANLDSAGGETVLDIIVDLGDQFQIDVGKIDFDPVVEFRDANADFIGANDDANHQGTLDSRLIAQTSSSGFHQIIVTDASGTGCGKFRISVTKLGTAVAPGKSPTFTESFPTFADTAINSETFYLLAGDTFTVSMFDDSSGADPYIELYDPSGNSVAFDDDSAGGFDATFTHVVSVSGEYRLDYLSLNAPGAVIFEYSIN